MDLCIPSESTVGEIARRSSFPAHRVEYVIRSRGIIPSGRAGNAYIYSEADVRRIVSELQIIDRERRQSPREEVVS